MHAQQDQDNTPAMTLSLLNSHLPATARVLDPQPSRVVAHALVGAQRRVLRWMADRHRTVSAALAAAAGAATCAAVLADSHLGRGAAVQIALAVTMVVSAMGESLLSAALPSSADDLAPPSVTGLHNGLGALAFIAGCMLGPAVSGAALGAGWDTSLLTTLAVACALASIAAHRLGPRRRTHKNPADEIALPPGGSLRLEPVRDR
jgi:MFS family permease